MNRYIILAVAVVSHCAPDKYLNPFGGITLVATNYSSPQPAAPEPACTASLDVFITTDTARAYAALEAGQRVLRVWTSLPNVITELHREAKTEYRITEQVVKP